MLFFSEIVLGYVWLPPDSFLSVCEQQSELHQEEVSTYSEPSQDYQPEMTDWEWIRNVS